ncbi:MAG TPA: M50 family metallopeptidase [bacterium]
MVDALSGLLTKGLVVVAAFGLLILVHELGHFVVARWSGVRILRFSIGFGPKLFGWRRGDTDYWVSWLPLGGYVKMAGEQASEHRQEPGEFLSKPVGIRALIVLAGPAVNYLSAVVLLWLFFWIGYPGLLPVVGDVTDGMPAQTAGFQPEDVVIRIEDRKISTWDEMTSLIRARAGEPLRMRVRRGDRDLTLEVTPVETVVTDAAGEELAIGMIGIGAGVLKVGPLGALALAGKTLHHWTLQTFAGLGSLVTGRRSLKESVTGPLGIVYLTSEAVSLGLGPLLILVSLFSLSLAIFNVFPIPVLDGGHLLFLAIEWLRGRPVSINVQERATMVGLALLLTLVLVVTVYDLNRYWLSK